MRGICGWGVHLPYRRLDRASIAAVTGGRPGSGTRTVASYDEDATTMAVQACRRALDGSRVVPRDLWLATAAPPYLDKTNATTVHAALRLERETGAYDAVGSVRSAAGVLRAALAGSGSVLVVASDVRTGLSGGADESAGGDAAAALLVGDDDSGVEVLASVLASVSLTEEFLDRWRPPGAATSRTWEERFGETRYVPLGTEALKLALAQAGVEPDEVGRLVVAGLHERACAAVARASGVPAERVADRLAGSVGNPGAAQPALLLAAALEAAQPGETLVLLVLSDGADAIVLRTTPALAAYRAAQPAEATVAAQLAAGGPVTYGSYLAWRGLLEPEPPRRPAPARTSAPAAARAVDWKFGLAAAASAEGEVHAPPLPGDAGAAVLAGLRGRVATSTVDRLAYSPSPPVVFAVVDLDGGGRLALELTDVEAGEVQAGMEVEMTFRRLSSADGIHNYFWKARPVRAVPSGGAAGAAAGPR